MLFNADKFTKVVGATLMVLGFTALSAPASAGTQKDIQACRTAITAQGTYDISEHRLRYLSHKGNRNRVFKLEAIPHKKGERFKLTCHLDRKRTVTAINDQPLLKLVKATPSK